jgi:hypothetical protein
MEVSKRYDYHYRDGERRFGYSAYRMLQSVPTIVESNQLKVLIRLGDPGKKRLAPNYWWR